MKRSSRTVARGATPNSELTRLDGARLALEDSLGYQVRVTHRAVQRLLQAKIAPFGVKLGMWYFLRVLWDEDGLTQRELSLRTGTKEPTTLHAIATMERSGLVSRRRNRGDRRKINVFLTRKGKQLEAKLMPLAINVVDAALKGFSKKEVRRMIRFLKSIQTNLNASLDEISESDN